MNKRFRWDKRYLYWGITAFCVIAACVIVFLGLSHWRSILSVLKFILSIMMPFVYGLVLAYLLNKPMVFFEKKVFRFIGRKNPERVHKLRRATSVFVTMTLFTVLLGGSLSLLMPQLYRSLERLVNALPEYFTIAIEWVGKFLEGNPQLEGVVLGVVGSVEENLIEWLKTTALAQLSTLLAGFSTGVIGLLREIINFTIGYVIAIYAMYHKEQFINQTKKLIYAAFKPRRASSVLGGLKFVDATCGSFIASKLLDSLIVGVVCWIAMTIAQIPYALLISIIVAVTNIIPFLGPFIGAVPSALLIFMESPMKCLIFIIIVLVIQQLDGNVLYPRLQGSALKLSGFWILFAIIFFGGLFGFWGMMLGVPVFYTIYHGVSIYIQSRLKKRGMPVETAAYASVVSLPGDPVAEDADQDNGGEE